MMELFNEIILIFILYTIMCFSDWLNDVRMQLKIGFIACGLVILHFLCNIALIAMATVKMLIRKVRMRHFRKLHR